MFQLTADEAAGLTFQFGTLKRGQHFKYLPRAFTQEGVAMLSSVLRSPRAVAVNVEIMRAFVRLRRAVISDAASSTSVPSAFRPRTMPAASDTIAPST